MLFARAAVRVRVVDWSVHNTIIGFSGVLGGSPKVEFGKRRLRV